MKRLLAMFLALAMILSCLPVMVFASGSDLPLTPQRTVKTEFAGVLPSVRAGEEYGTTDEVVVQIRQNLVARNSEFSACGRVPYSAETTEDDLMDMTLELLYDAMEHTGVPNEGDYLKSHYDGGTYGYSYYNDDQWFYVTFRYTVAYTTTAEQEAEVDIIVESLLPELRGLTDYETVCNIYDWFAENVRYDYDSEDDLKYSAYAALLYRMAVCQGYASALYRLALELGVPCRLVSGTADNGQVIGGHAWNKVKLGSSWYLLDATWDAIYAQKGLDYNFFLEGSDNFGTDHFPDEAYTDVSATDFDPASLELAEVASGICGDALSWVLTNDGTLTISGTGAMYDYIQDAPWTEYAPYIKKIIIGEGATTIGEFAFYYCDDLTDLTIPQGITSIGEYAFAYCESLPSVELPESLRSIGGRGFYSCAAMESINFPAGLTTIGEYAFSGCKSLPAVTIPASVTAIGDSAFIDCNSLSAIHVEENNTAYCDVDGVLCDKALTTVIQCPRGYSGSFAIPEGVTTIGRFAFGCCAGLTAVTIPESVTAIGVMAFHNCTGLTEIKLPANLTAIGDSVFENCDGLTAVTIPERVTAIERRAFIGCDGLTAVVIPEGVTSIGEYAFDRCKSLTEITFTGDAPSFGTDVFYNVTATAYYPAGNDTWTEDVRQNYGGTVTWVAYGEEPGVASGICGDDLTWVLTEDGTLTISGEGAMYNYSSSNQPWYSYRDSITEVMIEDGATIIGSNAFSCCTQLTEVTLPDTVISIFHYAFAGCVLLEEIILPESLGFINDCVFEGCTGLQQITLPAAVEHIGNCVFYNCSNLTRILVEEGNTCFSSVDGMLTDKTRTTLLFYPWGKGANCIIPEGITTLSKQPFYCCEALTSITVPASVTTIDDSSFHGCTNLTEITFLGDAPSFTNEFIFGGVTATAYYPADNDTWTEDVMQNYGGTITWVAVSDGPAVVASGTCGENLTWVLTEDGVLTISGEGAMTDYQGVVWDPETNIESSDIPWNDYQDSITCVVVEEGVTTVGNNAFSHYANITAVELPESLRSIGTFAFSGTGITSITIPAGVTDIDSTAFGVLWSAAGDYGCDLCDQLTRIDVDPANTAYASDQYGVLYSKDMTTLVRCPSGFSGDYRIPDSVTLIAPDALNHCIKLTSITIPDGIANYVSVTGCNSLEELTLPAAKTSLGCYAIANCANLKRVTLSANTEHIENNAFYKCPALAEIVFPGDAPVMGESAFQGVTATAYYPAGNDTWTEDVRQSYGGTITWVAYGEAEETPVAVIGDAEYASVAEALAAAKSGDTVTLVADAHEENAVLLLEAGVTLDLGVYDLHVNSIIAFNGSHLTGTEYRAATDYGRVFVPSANRLILSGQTVQNDGSVGLLPVWDGDQGCYVMGGAFYDAGNYTLTTDETTISFMFAPSLRGDLRKGLFTDAGEMSDNGLSIVLRLTWHSGDGLAQQDFVYSSEFVSKFCKSGSGLFTFKLTGYEAMYIELSDLTITPMIVCDNGLTFFGKTVTGA